MIARAAITGAALALLGMAGPAAAQAILGNDAAACAGGIGPAVRVNVTDLKDRIGRIKLELYPATEEDFLTDDRDLVKAGKFFHRIWAATPAAGAVVLCIKAPRPGRYALVFTHDRDDRNKFHLWKDGIGLPSNRKIGRSRPTLADSTINVGGGVTHLMIRAQYLRGLSGFAPYRPAN